MKQEKKKKKSRRKSMFTAQLPECVNVSSSGKFVVVVCGNYVGSFATRQEAIVARDNIRELFNKIRGR